MTKRRIAWTSVITAVLLAVMLAGAVWLWLFPDRDFLWITSNVEKNMAFFARGFAKMFFSHLFLIPFAVFAGTLLCFTRLLHIDKGIGTPLKVLSAVGIFLTFLPLLFSFASCVTEIPSDVWQFVVGGATVALQVVVLPGILLLLVAVAVLLVVALFARFREKRRKNLTDREVVS